MISRRDLLKPSTIVGLAPSFPALARDLAAPDYKIDIARRALIRATDTRAARVRVEIPRSWRHGGLDDQR